MRSMKRRREASGKERDKIKGAFTWFQAERWRLEFLLVRRLTLNTEPFDEINSFAVYYFEKGGRLPI